MSTLAYITSQNSRLAKITCHSNYAINLDDGGRSIVSDRRVFNIPLQESDPANYWISAIGTYHFFEKLINLTTEGTILAVSSKESSIPTKIVYFGSYDPFKQNSGID